MPKTSMSLKKEVKERFNTTKVKHMYANNIHNFSDGEFLNKLLDDYDGKNQMS